MLVQVVDELDDAVLALAADGDEVERGQVLDELAQPDAAGVRADGDAELGRQQQHRDDLVDPGEPAGVDLADADRLRLQQLLEDHAVLRVLPGRDPTGSTARAIAAWPSTSSGLVGSSIHVIPNGARRSIHAIAVVDVPGLVGVDAQLRRGPSASRAIAQRRTSSSTSAPTFSLTCVKPSSSASAISERSLSSS